MILFTRFFLTRLFGGLTFAIVSLMWVTNAAISNERAEQPARIIASAPSITETLFAIGAGPFVVGVSNYCHYPAEVEMLPKVCDLFNPNMEAMVSLRPTIVIVLKGNDRFRKQVERMGIATLTVDHNTISGILDSFETIGKYCSPACESRGRELRSNLELRMEQVRKATANRTRPAVFISIDRGRGTGYLTDIYAAGKNPWFNEILNIAGGKNVLADSPASVPSVSSEGIIELAPDVIIDLVTSGDDGMSEQAKKDFIAASIREWNTLGKTVPAVMNGRIYPMLESSVTVPGPRMILFIERLANILHPTEDSGP